MNTPWKGTVFLIVLTVVLTYTFVGALLGYTLGYFLHNNWWKDGALIFGIIGILVSIIAVSSPVSLILKGYNAVEATPVNEPRLYEIVRKLAKKANTPMPKVYVCNLNFPNAFALGKSPDKALVAATRPLMDTLTDDELEGIMAHELSHIIHRDTIINGTARTTAKSLSVSALVLGALGLLVLALFSSAAQSNGIGALIGLVIAIVLIPVALVCLLMLVAIPSASAIMKFGVSRSREFRADEGSARITGNPLALARALMILEQECAVPSNKFNDSSSASLWITNPFGKNRDKILARLFDTHPPTVDRVKRLIELDMEINGTG